MEMHDIMLYILTFKREEKNIIYKHIHVTACYNSMLEHGHIKMKLNNMFIYKYKSMLVNNKYN